MLTTIFVFFANKKHYVSQYCSNLSLWGDCCLREQWNKYSGFTYISNLLHLAFSLCAFRKDLHTQSFSVSPAAVGWVSHRVMRTILKSSEKALPPNHLHVTQKPHATVQTTLGDWNQHLVVQRRNTHADCFICFLISLSFQATSLSLTLLARQHVNDAPRSS